MIRKLLAASFLLTMLLGVGLFGPLVPKASAQVASTCDKSADFIAFPTWYKYLRVEEVNGKCEVTGPSTRDGQPCNDLYSADCRFDWRAGIGRIALAVVEILLRIAGFAAVIFTIYGGIKYILSQGEPDKTRNAKNTVVNALIGAAIAIIATGLVNFVARTLQ